MVLALLEITGVALGLTSTILLMRRHIGCWPAGILTVIALGIVFFEIKLYSAVLLQVAFLVLQIQGWITWAQKNKKEEDDDLQRLTPFLITSIVTILFSVTIALGYAMKVYSDAALPYWDAFGMVLYLIGQWLVIHKVVECWYFWGLANIITTFVYASQGLYFVALLHLAYTGISFSGLISWNKSYQEAEFVA